MSEELAEKTEKPTPRRLNKAREQGQVIQAPDLVKGTGMLASFSALMIFGGWVYDNLVYCFHYLYGNLHSIDLNVSNLHAFVTGGSLFFLKLILPFLAIAASVSVVISILEHGWNFTLVPLQPKFSKLNPVNGFSRIFSTRSLAELGKNIVKLIIIGTAIWSILTSQLREFQFLVDMTTSDMFKKIVVAVISLFARVTAVFLVLGIADFYISKFLYIKELKMSRQEVKEEFKEMEGDPKVKSKIRQIAIKTAYGATIQNTKKATVVITNPTHFAIALLYEAETMTAPKVIAKGTRQVALRMRQIATDANIPIVENPPLARALYRSVAVNQEIPGNFYQAVAEVLAYVYRLQDEQSGNRTHALS